MSELANVSAAFVPAPRRRAALLVRIYLTLAVPVLLALSSVRLVMTPTFLQLEYTRPGFTEDVYGFTAQHRLKYAPYLIEYLLNGEDIVFLSRLRLPRELCMSVGQGQADCAMFSAGELRHMRDVQAVTQAAYLAALAGAFLAIAALYTLGRREQTRAHLWRALASGSLLTLGMIAAVVVVALAAWDFFFTAFHTIFFEGGTWRFAYSDTLIRLFPEQFWFDAAVAVGTLTTLGAAVILLAAWRQGRYSVRYDV